MSPVLPRLSDMVWPETASYWIANASIPSCLVGPDHGFPSSDRDEAVLLLDVLVESGRIARIAAAGTAGSDADARVDLHRRQVWPAVRSLRAKRAARFRRRGNRQVRRGGPDQERCADDDKSEGEQLEGEKRPLRQRLAEERDAGCDRNRVAHQ